MGWDVEFYNNDLYKDLMRWPESIKAHFIRIVKMIEEYGANLGMPYTRSLGNGLFEIRAKGKDGIGRAFFCYVKKQRVIILHAFIKKTQQTPRKEIKIAKQRMKEV